MEACASLTDYDGGCPRNRSLKWISPINPAGNGKFMV